MSPAGGSRLRQAERSGEAPDAIAPIVERYKEALKAGHVAALEGRLDDALIEYRWAAAIADHRSLPHSCMGRVLLRLGRAGEALAAYAEALARAPGDEVALVGWAEALTVERYKEALKAGHVAALEGRLDDALTEYWWAAAIADHRSLPHSCMGRVLLRLGRADEALTTYAEALARAPGDEVALTGQAEALIAAGHDLGAAAALSRVAVTQQSEQPGLPARPTRGTTKSTLSRLVWRGLQGGLWIVLLGFILLLGLSRFTPYEVLIVRSGSMEPTINTGGIVIVDRNGHSPPVGTIATFRDLDGSVVTHRVVRMDGTRYVTRGDANRTDDVVTRPAVAVYGSVVLALPILGYVIHLLAQPVAFLVLLLCTGGFLVLDALGTILRELARMRRDRRVPDAN